MYGAKWCAPCYTNYFPWEKDQEDGHKCTPERIEKITRLNVKINIKNDQLDELEEDIRKLKEERHKWP